MSAIAVEEEMARATEVHDAELAKASVNKRELRVLQVFDGLGMGGAETWLMSLLKYFHTHNSELPANVKFDVLLTGGKKAVFDDEAEALGARLFYLPFTRRTLPRFVREFRKILATGNYDAIHDHQDYIAGLHFLAGAGYLPPVRIAHVHNPLYHRKHPSHGYGKRTINGFGKLLVGRYATHVMGTSRQIVTEYGFDDFSGRLTLGAANCGFDVSLYEGDYEKTHAELCYEFGWENSAKILLFVGRLDGAEFTFEGHRMTHKNPAFALEVAKECVLRDGRIKLLMVGDGEQKRTEFEAQTRSWNMANNIRFAGSRSDVPRLMVGSDLLLFPSVAEGLGMVVVEAQSAGLHVVASDTTPRESVVNPDAVTFCSLRKSSSEWAAEVLCLIDAPRPDIRHANSAVKESPFAIEQSATLLRSLYNPEAEQVTTSA